MICYFIFPIQVDLAILANFAPLKPSRKGWKDNGLDFFNIGLIIVFIYLTEHK